MFSLNNANAKFFASRILPIILILQILLQFLFLYDLQPSSSEMTRSHSIYASALQLFNPNAPQNEHSPKVLDAIVTIAYGDFTASRFVSMLTQLGKWTNDRPIYVITDKAAFGCRHKWDNYDKHNCEHDITFIDTNQYVPSFESEEQKQAWQMHQSLKAKWFKTQLFRLLPEHIHTILYVDADVEIRSPISIFENDLAHVLSSSPSSHCNAYYFQERFIEQLLSGMTYNSGIAMYFRTSSPPLLEQWGTLLLSLQYERDQSALIQAISATDSIVCALPQHHLRFQADVYERWKMWFLGDYENPTFFHFTSVKSLHHMRIPFNGTFFN